MAQSSQQGTGKHGHKDTQEPYPHHDAQQRGSRQDQHGGQSANHSGSGSRQHSGQSHGSEDQSLKQREYRDAEGDVHHHTKTYQQQHGGKS